MPNAPPVPPAPPVAFAVLLGSVFGGVVAIASRVALWAILNKRKIRARPPSDYMGELKAANKSLAATMKTHLIDDLDGFGAWTDDYDLFIRQRADAVSADLKKRIIVRDVDAHGQATRSDDLEEDMTTFE